MEHSCHQTIGHDLGNFRGFLNSWLSEQNDDFNLEASLALEKSRGWETNSGFIIRKSHGLRLKFSQKCKGKVNSQSNVIRNNLNLPVKHTKWV